MADALAQPPGVALQPSAATQTKTSASSLARDQRLLHRVDFLRVQKSNVRVTSRHFVFLLAPGLRPDNARVGITVSRKIGTSVVRNRARRLLREALRRLPEFVPAGIDMVIVMRTPPGQMRMQDTLAELQGIARLIGRRCQALCATTAQQSGGPA